MSRTTNTIFWLLFVAIGGTLVWGYTGNVVPAWVVVLLAIVTGAFGLVVFTKNMRDAKAAWSAMSSTPKTQRKPETSGVFPHDDSLR